MLSMLVNFAVVVIVYLFLIAVVIGIISKIVGSVKKTKTFIKDIKSRANLMERNEQAIVAQQTPSEAKYKWSQYGAVINFIQDRDLGAHFVWTNRENGIICVYNEASEATMYRVEFINKNGLAEVLSFESFDGTFHYKMDEEEENIKAAGNEAYYSAKVFADNEYRKDLLNQLMEYGGEAVYDAKRLNEGQALPENELRCVMEALKACDYEVIKADYEKSLIYIGLISDMAAEC